MNKYQKYFNYIKELEMGKTVDDQHLNGRVLIVDGL
jgi:hypothetical protein